MNRAVAGAARPACDTDPDPVYERLETLLRRNYVVYPTWVSSPWRPGVPRLLPATFGPLHVDHPALQLTARDRQTLFSLRATMPSSEITRIHAAGTHVVFPDPVTFSASTLWLSALPAAGVFVAWGSTLGWPATSDGRFFDTSSLREAVNRSLREIRPPLISAPNPDTGLTTSTLTTLSTTLQLPVYLRPRTLAPPRPFDTLTSRQARVLNPAVNATLRPATAAVNVLIRGTGLDRAGQAGAGWAALAPWATTSGLRVLAAVLAELAARTQKEMIDGTQTFVSNMLPAGYGASAGADTVDRRSGVPAYTQLLDREALTDVALTWEGDSTATGTAAPSLSDLLPDLPPARDADEAVSQLFGANENFDRTPRQMAAQLVLLSREWLSSLLVFIEDTFTRSSSCISRPAARVAAALTVRAMTLALPAYNVIQGICDVITGKNDVDPAQILPLCPLPAEVAAFRAELTTTFTTGTTEGAGAGDPRCHLAARTIHRFEGQGVEVSVPRTGEYSTGTGAGTGAGTGCMKEWDVDAWLSSVAGAPVTVPSPLPPADSSADLFISSDIPQLPQQQPDSDNTDMFSISLSSSSPPPAPTAPVRPRLPEDAAAFVNDLTTKMGLAPATASLTSTIVEAVFTAVHDGRLQSWQNCKK